MRIRPARPADAEVVRDLVQRAYGPYVERIGVRPGPMDDDYAEKVAAGHVFVAEDAGVAGLIVLVEEPDRLLIENVAVDPSRQGEGIGRRCSRTPRRTPAGPAWGPCGSTPTRR